MMPCHSWYNCDMKGQTGGTWNCRTSAISSTEHSNAWGHCFDYMNYEATGGQFRIHAAPGNPVFLASAADVKGMQVGTSIVKASDLPLCVLYRCGEGSGEALMRPLAKGETGAMLACPEWSRSVAGSIAS